MDNEITWIGFDKANGINSLSIAMRMWLSAQGPVILPGSLNISTSPYPEREMLVTEADWLSSTDPSAMLEVVRKDRQRVKNGPGWDNHYVISDRKARLFACAAARQVWDRLTDDALCRCITSHGMVCANCTPCSGTGRVNRSRRAVEVAEQYADGEATESERQAAIVERWPVESLPSLVLFNNAVEATQLVARGVRDGVEPTQAIKTALLRDVVGNPFNDKYAVRWGQMHEHAKGCAPRVPAWLTWHDGTVRRIAEAIYADRAFDRMDKLADALEEAGCTDEDVLMHLRGMERCPCAMNNLGPAHGNEEMCGGRRWIALRGPHCRGCWVLDLFLGKE